MDNVCSEVLEVKSGVPQGSFLGPLHFCGFINDLPYVLLFEEAFLFADDLKLLSLGYSLWNFQDNLHALEKWVLRNKMDLAMEKCLQVTVQGVSNQMKLFGEKLNGKQAVKNHAVTVQKSISWRLYVDTINCKANQFLNMLRRNVHQKKWITGKGELNYLNQLRLLNIFPLTMFLQLSDVLLIVKLVDDNCDLVFSEIVDEENREHEIFKLPKR